MGCKLLPNAAAFLAPDSTPLIYVYAADPGWCADPVVLEVKPADQELAAREFPRR
jgi:hypothetical protein